MYACEQVEAAMCGRLNNFSHKHLAVCGKSCIFVASSCSVPANAERQYRSHAVGLNINHDRSAIGQCQTVKVKAMEPFIPVPRKIN